MRFVERWKAEVKQQRNELPLSERLADWSRQVGSGAKTLWNFEVFWQDTIELDGKQIVVRRSITVGKILSALGILLIGYWICLHIARLIGRLAVPGSAWLRMSPINASGVEPRARPCLYRVPGWP